jgi:hypothetical protein
MSHTRLGTGPHSLHIDDQVLNPNGVLAYFGGVQPNFRLLPGLPPNLGTTTEAASNKYLGFNENGGYAEHNTHWKNFLNLIPSDKVLIAF